MLLPAWGQLFTLVLPISFGFTVDVIKKAVLGGYITKLRTNNETKVIITGVRER